MMWRSGGSDVENLAEMGTQPNRGGLEAGHAFRSTQQRQELAGGNGGATSQLWHLSPLKALQQHISGKLILLPFLPLLLS
jgi:hypothetical protein